MEFNKEELKEKVIAVLKDSWGGAIVYDVENIVYDDEEVDDENDDEFFFEFEYQIDDRIAENARLNKKSVIENIINKSKNLLKLEVDCSVDRMDAFPNGYAFYKTSIHSLYE